MEINELAMPYITEVTALPHIDNDRVLTYEGPYEHPRYGHCIARIYRSVRNDNGTAYHATVKALKAGEPYNIGFWDGDIIYYLTEDGYTLEVEK